MEKRGMIREWAEVPYVPARQYERKDSQPYRYLAARIRRQQAELFEDGEKVRHFAVVSNIWDMDGQETVGMAARQGRHYLAYSPHPGQFLLADPNPSSALIGGISITTFPTN